MNDWTEYFRHMLSTSSWLPHWQNHQLSESEIWMFIISNMLSFGACLVMPVIILTFVLRKNFSRFFKLYLLSSLFIFLCGLIFLVDALSVWYEIEQIDSFLRLLTGLVSWITLLALIYKIPVLLKFRSARELIVEVERHKTTEDLLRIKNNELNKAQEIAKMGHWEWDVLTGKLSWSYGLYLIYGLNPEKQDISFEQFIDLIHPDERTYVNNLISRAFEEKKFPDFYHRIKIGTGEVKTIHARGEVILDSSNNVIKMIGTGQDVTQERLIADELVLKTRKLEVTNEELQKFAYIASHDLQEPLRKIITNGLRLKEELSTIDNEKARVFTEKIINSTGRMQNLINDILRFSKINSEYTLQPVDLNKVASQIISDMEVTIEESGAEIIIGRLDHIMGNELHLGQVFQNLISNAIKFQHKSSIPKVTISSKIIKGIELNAEIKNKLMSNNSITDINKINESDYCLIEFADNGIGFNEDYSEKIFEVFQRFHSGENYKGTGVGLAVCKKIIENHRGVITVKSETNKGSVFTLTIPV